MTIHGESEDKVSNVQGFERFLCKSPLMSFVPRSKAADKCQLQPGQQVDVESDQPVAYGLYHMEYRFQGRLVAVGVLDILPRSISSVYLFYDPEYAFMRLGKVSAIREMALVKQIGRKQGMEKVKYYNLGLYIHSCQKMRYKSEYQPCELLDPETCTWLPYSTIKGQLDRGVRYNFMQHSVTEAVPQRDRGGSSTSDSSTSTNSDTEDRDEELPSPPPPGILDPTNLPASMIARCLVFDHNHIDLLTVSHCNA
jgi:arginine-tRNA-protein transferase